MAATFNTQHTATAEDEDANWPEEGLPVVTKYEFNDVSIPDDFLATEPPDAEPVTIKSIDWKSSVLPENKGLYAVILDNVISPSECVKMLELVEQSVPVEDRGKSNGRFWKPALVNIGGGFEVLESEYRNSDRIIWDQQTVVDRLWERVCQAPGLREKLSVIENDTNVLGPRVWKSGQGVGQRWEFRRLNKRMRFLKYGPGQFFRRKCSIDFKTPLRFADIYIAHCDGAYKEPGDDKIIKTHYTLHLYLNDSKATVGDKAELVGGATSFLSRDEKRKMDVDPKAGRVLIFQHRNLYHSGDDVLQGLKYTMRTDIMYELIRAKSFSNTADSV